MGKTAVSPYSVHRTFQHNKSLTVGMKPTVNTSTSIVSPCPKTQVCGIFSNRILTSFDSN